jgi:hypothetical protein
MDSERYSGRIRSWGVSAPASGLLSVLECLGRSPVVQYREDIFDQPTGAELSPVDARITYGALARAVPAVRQYLAQNPNNLGNWSERLGLDLRETSSLSRMLLCAALGRNKGGLVLFSTTQPARAKLAAEAVAQGGGLSDTCAAAMDDLAIAVRAACPEAFGSR